MIKIIIKENKTNKPIVFRGSDKDLSIDSFDLTKTVEFGFHFGSKESAEHRGKSKIDNFYLKKYQLDISNPLILDDLMRWDLENVCNELVRKKIIDRNKKQELIDLSVSKAKETNLSLRIQKNLILKDLLNSLGYDSIIYNNRGEAGGLAYIVWDKNKIQEIN